MVNTDRRKQPPYMSRTVPNRSSMTLIKTVRCLSVMKRQIFIAGFLLALFTAPATAQSNWVEQFLNRYQPPKLDPAPVTPQIGDEPWQNMVQQGALPMSLNDVIRLMLASN